MDRLSIADAVMCIQMASGAGVATLRDGAVHVECLETAAIAW
jgi:hypothetical protein